MKMFCESLREHTMEIANFKRRKKEVFNKGAAGIISKCKKKIFFRKKLNINMLKVKYIKKLEIIVIIEGNIEVLA